MKRDFYLSDEKTLKNHGNNDYYYEHVRIVRAHHMLNSLPGETMEAPDIALLLKKVSLFGNLNEQTVRQIASNCRKEVFDKGAAIFYQTDPSSNLYIVLSGKVNAILLDENGSEVVLAEFRKGEFFGELSLFDGKGRSATLVATERSELAVLKRDAFKALLISSPAIAIDLIVELALRLRKSNELIESLVFLDVRARLLKALWRISESDGEKSGSHVKIMKKTHHELASLVGASREAVTKCMKYLIENGVIKEEEGHILLSEEAQRESGFIEV